MDIIQPAEDKENESRKERLELLRSMAVEKLTDHEFRERVVLELQAQAQSPECAVRFALLCALADLPRIVATEKKVSKAREKMLYLPVFIALDASIIVLSILGKDITQKTGANAAYSAAYAAYDAADAYVAAYVVAEAVYSAAYAADAASEAVYSAARAASDSADFSDFSDFSDLFDFSAFAAYAAAEDTHARKAVLKILQAIKDQKPVPLEVEESLWQRFEQGLRACGCSYWFNYFKTYFDNGGQITPELLKQAKAHVNLPESVKAQGAAAAAHYLSEQRLGVEKLNEARLIVLGDKGAGKTSITRKLIKLDAELPKPEESTAGVDTHLWREGDCNIRIWDFAGHTVTHAAHKFFLSERCIYLIVYDGRTENPERLEHWLEQMANYGGDSQAFILVNQRDRRRHNIPINRLREKYNIFELYCFSIKDDCADLEGFRKDLLKNIQEALSWEANKIATSYFKVKQELENLFLNNEGEQQEEIISKARFDEIAEKYEVRDKDILLSNLHALGISLWYPQLDECLSSLVLNPEWISDGVYQMINWASEINEYAGYHISLEDLAKVFRESSERFPEKHHTFLFELMKHYELAYATDDGGSLIIPHLLLEDQPAKLPDFPMAESLMLRFQSEIPFPQDAISRFIVRHHSLIRRSDEVWRHGVILESKTNSVALVRQDDRCIEVSVKGVEKTKFLTQLREAFKIIFNDYKSKKPEDEYCISCREFGLSREAEINDPLWLSGRVIAGYADKGRTYYDAISNRELDMVSESQRLNIENAHFYAGSILNAGDGNETHIQVNYQDCNFELQGSLNDLAEQLKIIGQDQHASELIQASATLEKVEDARDGKELVKSGALKPVQRILEELNNEKSTLNQAIRGINKGKSIAQDIAEQYNKIAEWAALPQVPKIFLKDKS